MELKKLNLQDEDQVSFLEKLYEESFPKKERRPKERMLRVYKENKKFTILLAWEEKNPIGFFTYWDLDTFVYAEHFAVSAYHRNKGYGKKILNLIKEQITKPIILEAELPIEEMAKRRIFFYQREGFTLWKSTDYNQPSYYNDGNAYPMKLMSIGKVNEEIDSQSIIHSLYTIPYKN